MKPTFFTFLFLLGGLTLFAKQPLLAIKELNSPPPRIIRTCCSFGAEVKLMGLPGLKITEVIGVDALGTHKFLGDKKKREGNGIIYTKNGGFIDMGHVRDQADWTAYLYHLITNSKGTSINQTLGHEGGLKTLTVDIPTNISPTDARQLAGKIAYDLSVWHEIATWYGASSIPFVPERFSSFSVEDAYSNLLGVTLGIQAIESDLPYEVAMTQLILSTLENLEAIQTEAGSIQAMEAVRDIWWTREKKLPSKKILLKRQLNVYPAVAPLLIDESSDNASANFRLTVPQLTKKGEFLSSYYELSFKLNKKVPFRKLFPNRKKRQITQADFPFLIKAIEKEIYLGKMKDLAVLERKLARIERKRDKENQKLK
ncbi:MAG: DUF4056 domain-containing protein [Saprospiraceae bacterium]